MSWSLKNGYLASAGKQIIIQIFSNLDVYFLEKYNELSKSIVFGQKMYFTDQNGPKEGTTWKWILSIFKFRNEC